MPKRSIARIAQRAKTEDNKARKAHAARTEDSFQNFALQLGIGTDNALSASSYGFNPITRIRTLLEWIYRGSWLGGVAVDLVAEDMTRAGVSLEGEIDPSDSDAIEEEATSCGIWNAVCDTIKWSRLYGGAIAVMLIDGQDPSTELRIERVGKGTFKGLMVLDRWMVEPSLNDLVTSFGPNLGLPKFYRVVADAPALPRMTVHYSRCIRMEGIHLPYWQRVMENLWGLSVLERLYDRMVMFDSATTGAAQLMYKSYLRTYKIKDLREAIAAGGPALEGIVKMVEMMRRFQSNEGITLLDAEDEFVANAANTFSGAGDLLVHLGEQLSGALQIPLVRLFGQSPVGLSATGESDLRTYYDGIRQQQEKTLHVPMTAIYRVIAKSMGITLPDGFGVEFNPLWQLKDEERATVAQAVMTTVTGYADAGLISPQTALKEFKQSARVTGIGTNVTSEEIEAAEELPAPPVEEDPEGVVGEPDDKAGKGKAAA